MWLKEEQKNGKKRLEALIGEFGLSTNATIVVKTIVKNSLTSTVSNATSATINATDVIAKRLCLLMNKILGKAVSPKLLKEVEEVKNTRFGNRWYSNVMGMHVYGVEGMKGWKLTTLKGGVPTKNSVMSYPTDEHSV